MNNIIKQCYLGLFLFTILSSIVRAKDFTSLSIEELGEIDVFPGTVLDTHIHQKNDIMFAIYQGYSETDTLRAGTQNISNTEVFSKYRVAPTRMTMSMTMLHAMYAYSDKLTLAAMTHFMKMSMDHETQMGQKFTTHTKGISDSALTLNYLFRENQQGNKRWVIHSSLILPTGSINEKDMTPMGNVQLPYTMQLGSGSYQIKFGIDYTITGPNYIISNKLFTQSALNTNKANYKVGTITAIDLSYIYSLNDILSIDFHLNYEQQNAISGLDERLNPSMVPTANTLNTGGKLLDINIGTSWLLPHKNKISFSINKPLWQNTNGIQLKNNGQINIGWEITL